MRPWIRKSLLAAAVGAAALLAADQLIRLINPFGISQYRDNSRYFRHAVQPVELVPDGRLFEHRASVELQMRAFRVCTDALGLRAAEPGAALPPRDAQHMRVLFLGDSSTFGWGVDDAQTWVRTLERDARAHDGRALECLNAGHLMYDTVQEAALLSAWGPVLKPELVLVVFNSNDLDLSWDAYGRLLESSRTSWLASSHAGAVQRASEFLGGCFPGFAGLAILYGQKRITTEYQDAGFSALEALPGYPANWPRVARALERILATCRANHMSLALLDHARPRVPEVRRWCGERGVPWIDLAFSAQEWRQDIRVSEADSHANAYGNQLLAHKAQLGLSECGILSAPARPAGDS